MTHKHSVYDTDSHFSINAITRAIKNESSKKTTLMQHDHNSERFTFEVPRLVEGHDMSLCDKIEVHYINISSANKADTSADVYLVDDMQISPAAEEEDVVIFSWLISGNATKYAGTLSFMIRFLCLDGSTITYSWNTAVSNDIFIGNGMNNTEAIIEEHSDILEAWKAEIYSYFNNNLANKVDKSSLVTEPIAGAIPKYNSNGILKGNTAQTDNDLVNLGQLNNKAVEVIEEVNAETTKMEKRIEQLEGLTLKTIEDSTEAYEKVVPVGVGTTAAINRVGGKSYVHNHCICDKEYKLDNVSSQDFNFGELEAGEYTLFFEGSFTGMQKLIVSGVGFMDNFFNGNPNKEFTLRLDTKTNVTVTIISEYYDTGDDTCPTLNGTITGIKLYKDGEGLRAAKPKSIESRGANLFDGSIINTGTFEGITVEYDEETQTFTLNGTTTSAALIASTNINKKGKKGDNYTIKNEIVGGSVSGGSSVVFFGAADAPNTSTNWLNTSIVQSSGKTNTLTYDYITKFWFYATQGVVFDNLKLKVMLAQTSDTTIPYKPYSAEPIATFEIPEAIRNREGYGLSGSYIDFDKRVWVDADGKERDVSADLNYDDDFLFIEVEPGGTLKFVNEEGIEEAVPSTVTYITKV